MRIACLGWGSLVWNPANLPIKGDWQFDGPYLPIEFARQSQDNRITLVCVPTSPSVQSLWALLTSTTIDHAREALRARECIPQRNMNNHIGVWTSNQAATNDLSATIGTWAIALQLDAVIWTNLPPKFQGKDGTIPTAEEVIQHLSGLRDEEQHKAEHYIRMAPRQIRTPYRTAIEEQLQWLPDERVV